MIGEYGPRYQIGQEVSKRHRRDDCEQKDQITSSRRAIAQRQQVPGEEQSKDYIVQTGYGEEIMKEEMIHKPASARIFILS